MGRYKDLMNKSVATLKTDGAKVFVKKSINYIKKTRNANYNISDAEKTYMDVLFINGCYLPHPSRYRVSHQREQLLANGIASNEVFFEEVSLSLIKKYRVFIFFRCPITDTIEKFITYAKKYNKVVLFDIDDLVIDTKYTNNIKYLKSMTKKEKDNYDSGVNRMKKTLLMCDGAITTTERLAEELSHYVPEVFINRNVASDRMVQLSQNAICSRDVIPFMEENKFTKKEIKLARKLKAISEERKRSGKIRIGYFSGSITHNDDFSMILPSIVRIMEENKNVLLCVVGELDLPDELRPFSSRVKSMPFTEWIKLPKLIASVDINIVPLEQSIFNEAKSENKWVEASLVKVATIASNVGALKKMIVQNETGILCDTVEDWYYALKELAENEEKRKKLADNAYKYTMKKCISIYTGFHLSKYLKQKMTPNIAFVFPSTQISGGILIALHHAKVMRNCGYDIIILSDGFEEKNIHLEKETFFVLSRNITQIHGSFDKCVATLWSTISFLTLYPNIKERYYLVQGFETDFAPFGNFSKTLANQTYSLCIPIQYNTVSKWCQKWLLEDYEKPSEYIPNGIDNKKFYPKKRDFRGKIRILIEGNCNDDTKNIDESFKIVQELDKDKFEIWYMSYLGEPKKWYRVDKFLHKVPHEKVPYVYRKCHILIKSSILESFSYPPLEMMATGGFVVVVPNDGNIEYLEHLNNCMFYKQGDIKGAVSAIERICKDSELRDRLYESGLKTAESRSWEKIDSIIADVYNKDSGYKE